MPTQADDLLLLSSTKNNNTYLYHAVNIAASGDFCIAVVMMVKVVWLYEYSDKQDNDASNRTTNLYGKKLGSIQTKRMVHVYPGDVANTAQTIRGTFLWGHSLFVQYHIMSP